MESTTRFGLGSGSAPLRFHIAVTRAQVPEVGLASPALSKPRSVPVKPTLLHSPCPDPSGSQQPTVTSVDDLVPVPHMWSGTVTAAPHHCGHLHQNLAFLRGRQHPLVDVYLLAQPGTCLPW